MRLAKSSQWSSMVLESLCFNCVSVFNDYKDTHFQQHAKLNKNRMWLCNFPYFLLICKFHFGVDIRFRHISALPHKQRETHMLLCVHVVASGHTNHIHTITFSRINESS